MGGDPQAIIETLGLAPHPEGGWYRETWREGADAGCRGLATGIYFLLEAGQRSHWHRVDAAELWLFHAGTPLTLSIAAGDAGPVEAIIVGPDPCSGHRPQAIVPKGWCRASSRRASNSPAGSLLPRDGDRATERSLLARIASRGHIRGRPTLRERRLARG